MSAEPRSAIVAAISLPAPLESIRVRETADARRGVPAHVTLLFPFIPAARVGPDVLEQVAEVVAGTPVFDIEFRGVRRWGTGGSGEGLVWLAPQPAEPFVRLITALAAAFPDYPPYGGAHETVVPHLTLATDAARRFDLIELEAERHLPFRRRVDAATLLVEGSDGRWRPEWRFPLGGQGAKGH